MTKISYKAKQGNHSFNEFFTDDELCDKETAEEGYDILDNEVSESQELILLDPSTKDSTPKDIVTELKSIIPGLIEVKTLEELRSYLDRGMIGHGTFNAGKHALEQGKPLMISIPTVQPSP